MENTPHWYAIHTKPKQEERTDENLRAWRVETFSPWLKVRRYDRLSKSTTYQIKPLFPGYIFARFNAQEMYHKVRFTRGVHEIVSFGGNPLPVDDEIIETVKARIREDGFVRLEEDFKKDDKVIIHEGPLKGFVGLFKRSMKDKERIMILLTTLKNQVWLDIDAAAVKRAQ